MAIRAFVLAVLATFLPGSFGTRLKATGAVVLEGPDEEPLKSFFYGSKAWRASHRVNIGSECEGTTMQTEEVGGSTINSVHKESPKVCGALCENTKGCVAWSWNKVNEKCYLQNSCEWLVPNSDIVSGMKASFEGTWYHTTGPDAFDFNIDHTHYLQIYVDQNGEMTLEDVDVRGKLEMASGSGHDGRHRGDELEVRLEGSDKPSVGTMRVRLTDGKMKVRFWLPDEDNPTEYTAEKKEIVFKPLQRVTIKEDLVTAASDVRFWPGNTPGTQPLTLKQGDGGTVDDVLHPRKTGVIFDQHQDTTVWVSDALLVNTTFLEEVSEEDVKDVLENLGDDLILAIRDPITKQILRDPVKAADGYTYERSSIEEPVRQPQEDFKALTTDFTMRSLVSSVIQKVNAALARKRALSEEVSEQEVKAVLKNLGDDLIEAISDPITWQILRDPVKAADGFTYERQSIEKWIRQAQLEFRTPKNHFGTPLSSVKLTPDYTIRSLLSSLIQKVNTARAAGGNIQKHWRGFQVRKDTSQLEAKRALVERLMEDHRRQTSKRQQKLSVLEKRRQRKLSVLSGHALAAKLEQVKVSGKSQK